MVSQCYLGSLEKNNFFCIFLLKMSGLVDDNQKHNFLRWKWGKTVNQNLYFMVIS